MRRRGHHFVFLTLLALLAVRPAFAAVANAGPDQTVPERSTVTLDASQSTAQQGGTLSFQWRQTKGPAVALADPTSAVTTFVAPEAKSRETLQFQVTVSETVDGGGGEQKKLKNDTDSVAIIVLNTDTPNSPPVANAGPDRQVKSNDAVVLDGAASTDPDNDPLTYFWTQLSGTPVLLTRVSPSAVSFTAPTVSAPTPLAFRLTVSDGRGGFAADDAVVTVLPPGAAGAPTADAGPDQNAAPGGTVKLDGSRSSNPDETPLTYHWDQIGGPTVTLQNADSAVATFLAPVVSGPATLQFRLTVTNPNGASTDVVAIQVAPSPEAPPPASASISNLSIYPDPFTPHEGPVNIEYDLGANCDVVVHIYDIFGDGVRVLNASAGGPGGIAGRTKITWDGRNGRGDLVGNGGYVLEIEATDGNGKTVKTHGRLAVVK